MNQLFLKFNALCLLLPIFIHAADPLELNTLASSHVYQTDTKGCTGSQEWETINQERVARQTAKIAALEVRFGHMRKVVILTTLAGTGILSYYAWNAWQKDSLAIKTSPEKLHEIFSSLPESQQIAIIKAGTNATVKAQTEDSSFASECLETVKTLAKPLLSGILIKTISTTLTNVLLKPIEPAILSVRKLLQTNLQPCFNEATALQFIAQSTRIPTLVASLKRAIIGFDNNTTYIKELYNNLVYQTESLFGYMRYKLLTFDTQLHGYTQQAGLLQIDSIADQIAIVRQKLVTMHDQSDLDAIVAACCTFENEVKTKAKEFSELYQAIAQS